MSNLPRPPGLGVGVCQVPGGAEFDATRPLVDLGSRPNLARRQLGKARDRVELPGEVVLGWPIGPRKSDIPRQF